MKHTYETGQPVEVYNHIKNRWQPASYTGRVGVYYKAQLQRGMHVHVPAEFIRPRTNTGA